MAEDRKEPTERTPQGLEVPIPRRADFLRNLEKLAQPKPDGPQEVEDSAGQESDYPGDEANEG